MTKQLALEIEVHSMMYLDERDDFGEISSVS